jgi:hypothetical protein
MSSKAVGARAGGLPEQFAFGDGLVGLPEFRTFSVRPVDDARVVELECIEEPEFGVVAAAADMVRPGMTDELADRGLVGPGERLWVLLAVHGDPPVMTANLCGPLVVGPDGVARQLVLEDPVYELRAPIAPVAG